MIVTQQTTKLPQDAHPSDFNFAYEVIEEMKRLPLKSRVFFPAENRQQVESTVACKLEYDRIGRPQVEFHFSCPALGFEMAHTAVVTTYIEDGVIKYKLVIRPNKRLRSNGHRGLTSIHSTASSVALSVNQNYFPGSTGRKVISMVVKESQPA